MAIDKEKNAQFLLTVPRDMLELIEKHQDKNSFMNRNEAIRDLIKIGLSTSSGERYEK